MLTLCVTHGIKQTHARSSRSALCGATAASVAARIGIEYRHGHQMEGVSKAMGKRNGGGEQWWWQTSAINMGMLGAWSVGEQASMEQAGRGE